MNLIHNGRYLVLQNNYKDKNKNKKNFAEKIRIIFK